MLISMDPKTRKFREGNNPLPSTCLTPWPAVPLKSSGGLWAFINNAGWSWWWEGRRKGMRNFPSMNVLKLTGGLQAGKGCHKTITNWLIGKGGGHSDVRKQEAKLICGFLICFSHSFLVSSKMGMIMEHGAARCWHTRRTTMNQKTGLGHYDMWAWPLKSKRRVKDRRLYPMKQGGAGMWD